MNIHELYCFAVLQKTRNLHEKQTLQPETTPKILSTDNNYMFLVFCAQPESEILHIKHG